MQRYSPLRILFLLPLLGLLCACSTTPETSPSSSISPSPTQSVGQAEAASILIDAATSLISSGEYAAAQALLDQLDTLPVPDSAQEALALLRGTLEARLAEDGTATDADMPSLPVISVTPVPDSGADPDLLDQRRQEISTFLSCFSQQDLSTFSSSDYRWDELISFALRYLVLNGDASDDGTSDSWVDAQQVEETVSRFFGLETRHTSGDWFTYRDERYFFSRSAVAAKALVCLATGSTALGDGQYSITFDVYQGQSGEDMSAYYALTSYQASQSLTLAGSGEAILQAVTDGGRETFQLLEYHLQE